MRLSTYISLLKIWNVRFHQGRETTFRFLVIKQQDLDISYSNLRFNDYDKYQNSMENEALESLD
jgi:hypothetical protein